MKSIILYYNCNIITASFAGVVFLGRPASLVYCFITGLCLTYRTVTDGARLDDKHLMNWNQVWKLLIPGKRLEYVKGLYFRR